MCLVGDAQPHSLRCSGVIRVVVAPRPTMKLPRLLQVLSIDGDVVRQQRHVVRRLHGDLGVGSIQLDRLETVVEFERSTEIQGEDLPFLRDVRYDGDFNSTIWVQE